MEYMNLENQVAISDEESEILDNESSSYEQFGFLIRKGMVRVKEREDDTHVNMIKNVFLISTRKFGDDTRIVAIHRHSRLGLAGESWAERFRICSEAVAKKNGRAANIKYGWYGGPKDEICKILSYGFCRCKRPLNSKLFGHGVYLSPSNFCIDCVPSSTADENGLRHMLLCRVLLGNTEEVCAGSEQFHPSCTDFDSGVDNLSAPTKYIIWSPYMNSHILPSFVISFTVSPSSSLHTIQLKYLDSSPPSLHDVIVVLANYLDSSTMNLIAKHHNDFQSGKITLSQMGESLRNIVGDKLFTAAIAISNVKNLEQNLDATVRSSTGELPTSPRRGAATYSSNSKSKKDISKLMEELSKHLDSSKMGSIAKVYVEYRRNKTTCTQMIRSLRTIAGDKLLLAAAKKILRQENQDDMIRSSTGEVVTGCAATNSSKSMCLTIPNLIRILAKDLDFSKRVSVAQVYSQLRRKTITKAQMIRNLRTIAGDKLLTAAAAKAAFKRKASFPKSLPDVSPLFQTE